MAPLTKEQEQTPQQVRDELSRHLDENPAWPWILATVAWAVITVEVVVFEGVGASFGLSSFVTVWLGWRLSQLLTARHLARKFIEDVKPSQAEP